MTRPKTGLFISLSAVLAAGIVWLTIFFMYSTAIQEERGRLTEAVLIQVKLIETMAQFDANYSQTGLEGEPRAAMLSQIRTAYGSYREQDARVEFVIGHRSGDHIEFLISGHSEADGLPSPVPLEGSQIAEPMRRALAGKSGTIVGKDYDGILVLAAYAPIPSLQIGLVQKITVDQLRAPFIRTGLLTAAGSGLVIVLGLLTLLRTAHSINHQLNQQTEALREGEARMRSIVDNAIDGIITINTHGNIETFNPAAERTFGYQASEVIGENVKMLMPAPYHDEHDGYLTNYLKTGVRKIIGIGREVIGLRKDGSTFPMELGVSETVIGTERIFTGLVRNITARVNGEKQIRQLTERLSLATESAKIGVWEFDVKDRSFTTWDAHMYALYGIQPEDFDGPYNAWIHIIHPEDIDRARNEMREAIASKGEVHTTFRVCWPNGEEKTLQAHGVTSCSPDGTVERVYGVNWDITNEVQKTTMMKNLNAILLRQKEDLRIEKNRAQESDRVKSAFLATMSHELRTPLNSIIGFTDIVIKQIPGPLNDEQTKQLKMVYGSSIHLLALINDVLDISKIEAGELKVSFRPFDLHASINKVVESVRPLAVRKGLLLESRVEPNIGTINSDARRVEQVAINLLNNAIKFTEQGNVLIECHREKDRIVMQVKDTGIGIKKEDLDLLFKPFHQVGSGLNRMKEGTGLGLSICIRLSELLHGTISVESEWGSGSLFTFALPADHQEDME